LKFFLDGYFKDIGWSEVANSSSINFDIKNSCG
jgi:hypothetical protein